MNFPDTLAIILAAGSGTRFGGDKITLRLGGRPVIYSAVMPFLKLCAQVVVVVAPDARSRVMDCFSPNDKLPNDKLPNDKLHVVIGGDTRHESLKKALEAWQSLASNALAVESSITEPSYVLIHDAARPCIDWPLIERVQTALSGSESGAVVPVLPSYDTVYNIDKSNLRSLPRENILHAQTPQGFHYHELTSLVSANRDNNYTDEVSLFIAHNKPVITVAGDADNIKITSPADGRRVARFFAGQRTTKTGFGVDVHRMAQGTGMTLGGYHLACDYVLVGHSDADVVLHALCDAIYGVLADGDIGVHFPPSDEKWRGESSATFLHHAMLRLTEKGGVIEHIDLTIITEHPKIAPHRDGICLSVAALCRVSLSQVSLKATTSEGLGFTGRGEGMTTFAQITASFECL